MRTRNLLAIALTTALLVAVSAANARNPIPIESFAKVPEIQSVSMSTDGRNIVAVLGKPGATEFDSTLATWDLENLDAGPTLTASGDKMRFIAASALKADRVFVFARQEWTGALQGCGEGNSTGSTKTFVSKAYLTDTKHSEFSEAFAAGTRTAGVSAQTERCLELAGSASLVNGLPLDPTKVIVSRLNPLTFQENYYRYDLKDDKTELLFRAAAVHREHFDPAQVQVSTLLSVKTGGCPEDCAYCPQAQRYDTGVNAQKLMDADEVLARAAQAKAAGASRFCMGAAWRSPKDRDIPKVAEMIRGVKALGLETCATLGMLSGQQAQALKDAGLDYYNHNLDSAPDFYGEVITTRDYQDRLDTLERVRGAGVKVCCGGIVGMGESRRQRAGLVAQLANLSPDYPESVPINNLVKVQGTPLADQPDLDPLEFVRTIAVARITMPRARVRLSAGRQQMSEAVQALCFLAGANSIFYGEKLLTTGNPDVAADMALLDKLGITARRA